MEELKCDHRGCNEDAFWLIDSKQTPPWENYAVTCPAHLSGLCSLLSDNTVKRITDENVQEIIRLRAESTGEHRRA